MGISGGCFIQRVRAMLATLHAKFSEANALKTLSKAWVVETMRACASQKVCPLNECNSALPPNTSEGLLDTPRENNGQMKGLCCFCHCGSHTARKMGKNGKLERAKLVRGYNTQFGLLDCSP